MSLSSPAAEAATIQRARCDGWEGYRNGRSHLVALDRLIDWKKSNIGHPAGITAMGPCPVCNRGWIVRYGDHAPAAKRGTYLLVGVKGTKVAEKLCNAACRLSASAECKCSCGGADHGMHA